MASKDSGDNNSDHSCDSLCSCNWDWNNLTFSQEDKVEMCYREAEAYYESHPDSPLNLPELTPPQCEEGSTSNPLPITQIPQLPVIDYNSKEWKDCKLFIDCGGKLPVFRFVYVFPSSIITNTRNVCRCGGCS